VALGAGGLARGLSAALLPGAAAVLALVLLAAGVGVPLLVAVPAVRAGRLDGAALTVLALTALASFEAVAGLPAAFQQLGANLAAARRLLAVADAPPAVRDPAVPLPAPAAGRVTLQGVRLRYGPREPWALDGVDLRLDPGRRVAVVGPSGAGKTSLAMALLRLRDLDGGRATLGGHDLREYAASDVRRVIGLATQDAHLFNTTIRENLRLAGPGPATRSWRRRPVG
jgi:ABC-type transport system involved in cytochrome bd biosynthesis fused ATPase/permease subunit